MANELTTEEFVRRAKAIHGDKYDYSKVVYQKKDSKVCIICPKHGEFWQTPHNHSRGQKCPKCALENKTMTTEKFIAKAQAIHGNMYDYSKVNYVDTKTKVCIICPIHGEFWQRPDIHLRGSICPKCSNNKKAKDLEYYIELSKAKHGDVFDFSNAIYRGNHKKTEIKCKKCGYTFYSTLPALIKNQGCRMCKVEPDRRISHIDGEIWRDIKKFKGYQVSNFGRVRSLDRIIKVGSNMRNVDGIILKTNKDKDGYEIIGFKIGDGDKGQRMRVHRLVAEAFIPNPDNYPCIDHINGIRDDNNVTNLRWCTVKMNSNYELAKKNRAEAIRQSYINDPNLRIVRAKTFGKSNMKRVEVFKNEKSLGVFESQSEAASVLGIPQASISSLMLKGNKNKNGITVKRV